MSGTCGKLRIALVTSWGVCVSVGPRTAIGTQAHPATPSAAEIVRKARSSEDAVHALESLHVRLDETWTTHAEGLAHDRQAKKDNPDDRFGLPEEGVKHGTVEIAFDARRLLGDLVRSLSI